MLNILGSEIIGSKMFLIFGANLLFAGNVAVEFLLAIKEKHSVPVRYYAEKPVSTICKWPNFLAENPFAVALLEIYGIFQFRYCVTNAPFLY